MLSAIATRSTTKSRSRPHSRVLTEIRIDHHAVAESSAEYRPGLVESGDWLVSIDGQLASDAIANSNDIELVWDGEVSPKERQEIISEIQVSGFFEGDPGKLTGANLKQKLTSSSPKCSADVRVKASNVEACGVHRDCHNCR